MPARAEGGSMAARRRRFLGRSLAWGAAVGMLLASHAGVQGQTRQAPGQAVQALNTYGLTITPLVWTVRGDDDSERRIEGVVVRGVALHPTKEDSARPIRMILMPAGPQKNQEGGDAPTLAYDVFVAQAASGRFEGINLRSGVALVELLPAARADHPAVRESLSRGRTGASGDDGGQHDTPVSFFPRWPMIITHAMVAGAEGTRLLVLSTPEQEGRRTRTLVGLLEGDSAAVDWEANRGQPVQLRERERTCITSEGERRQHAAPNGQQQQHMNDALRALEAGWKAAFADEPR